MGMGGGEVIEIVLDNLVRIKLSSLPARGVELFKNRLTFRNPLYEKNKRHGRSVENIKPQLQAIWVEEEKDLISMTRGYLGEVIRILQVNRYRPKVIDETRKFEPVPFFDSSIGMEGRDLKTPEQSEALEEICKNRFGILVGPKESGKRLITCKAVARRKMPALIIVSSINDLYVWREAAIKYLGLSVEDIGLIGDGSMHLGRVFTIAIARSLWKVFDEVVRQIGFLIVDRINECSLKVLFKTAYFDCPYVLGLGYGRNRGDGLTALMLAYIGPRVYELPVQAFQFGRRPVLRIRETGFDCSCREWPDLMKALCGDVSRNSLIVTDILQSLANPGGRKGIVISSRINHLELLGEEIKRAEGPGFEILSGKTSVKDRNRMMRRFDQGNLSLILCVQKSIPSLETKKVNCVFVAAPFRMSDHLSQVISSLFDNEARKEPVIFDYKDRQEILRATLNKRLKVYRAMGVIAERP